MIPVRLLTTLRSIVGPDHVKSGLVDLEVYSYDASLAPGRPDVVVFPADTDETAAVLRAAADAGAPCVPRGFGTNLSGGSVATKGGVVLCFTRMNRILAIEPGQRYAVVQPGVTNLELQNALAEHGFLFAPDPASQKVSTIGGNVAENAGGPHCVKYGVMTNHVLGLEAVLPGGEVVQLGGPALDPPGYDARGLVVGSEGTLAVVTAATVRILPKQESLITMLAVYDSVENAARSVSSIIAKGIVPATLEMMDGPITRAVEERLHCGYPMDAEGVLIIEVEGIETGLRQEADAIQAICRENGCRSIQEAKDAAERNQLWSGRRGAFGAIARIEPNFYAADCTVPRNRLPEALAGVAEIAGRYGFKYGNVLHAGDGNLHPVLFFDGTDPEEVQRVHKAGHEIMQTCVDLGGTLSGEHGIGVEKQPEMAILFPEESLDFQRKVQQAFDPNNTLNPGKIFPEPRPLDPSPKPPAIDFGDELTPADVAEACDMVRAAAATGAALLPVGNGRRADFGNVSERNLTRLHSEKLSGLVEFDPDNQVAIFSAGAKLAEVQEFLSEHGQWLPLRPALLDACTLGGMAALGACGPERLAYGAMRDRVLGLKFVSGEGREIIAGGRCVKNVAGYDVTRLLVGSAGTLGFITELTLYIATAPEACRAIHATGTLDQCAAAAVGVLKSTLWPTFATATPADSAWTLRVGFEGFDVTVATQIERCAKLMARAGLDVGGATDYLLREGFHANDYQRVFDSPFVIRADVPVGEPAGRLVQSCAALAAADMLLDVGCGRVWAGAGTLSDDGWRQLCQAAPGHVVLEKAPAEFKQRHAVFGAEQPAWRLTHRLKAALDPHGVFAPGRLPGKR